MFTLESFGITPAVVTATILSYAISFIVACAAAIVLWCLFGIGLARIAEKKGEEKPFYAYLPLLRFYTLGKMIPCQKYKKIFACLLPSLAIAKFVMSVICAALLARAAAGIIFAAEHMSGSSIPLSSLIEFPLSYCMAALIIAAIIALVFKISLAVCCFGAYESMGKTTAIVFTVITFLCWGLAGVFLFVAARKECGENTAEPQEAEEKE